MPGPNPEPSEPELPSFPESPRLFPCIWQAILLLIGLWVMEFSGAILIKLTVDLASLFKVSRLTPTHPIFTWMFFVLAFTPILLFSFGIAGRKFRELFKVRSFNWLILLPLAMLLIGLSIMASEIDNIIQYFLPMPENLRQFFIKLSQGGIMALISLAFFPPVFEEILFRGIILPGFLSHYSSRKAILLSALLFAIAHLNLYQFTSALLAGLLLGWLYYRTKSLWPCIFGHAFYNSINWFTINVCNFKISGYTSGLETNEILFQPWWFNLGGAVLLALGLIMLILMLQGKFETENSVLPEISVVGRRNRPPPA